MKNNPILILLSFLIFMLLGCSTKPKNIAIQPYTGISISVIDSLKKTIELTYKLPVCVLPIQQLPNEAFVNIKSPRYRADKIIAIQKAQKTDSIDCIIGLTNKDISTTKKDENGDVKTPLSKYQDWGVIGLGYRPGPSCVVSTFRIQTKNPDLLLERFKKVCIHELGQNMGLKHCTHDPTCCMRDAAETVKTIDKVELKLCDYCLSNIN